jgi:60 kDa SS-A/Ro ribonucleoprotein
VKYTKLVGQPVPQSEPLDERQVENNAGGFVYQLNDWDRLDRFLILGSDSNTYYQSAKKLTKENSACVQRCYDADYERTIARIVEISDSGRAAKNDPAIFALAIGACHTDIKVRQAALQAMPKVCRIGTHLFQFVACCRALGRGWGRAMKRAVARWYDNRSVESVAYQAIKYRNREGYSHKRLLQTAHPTGPDEGREASGILGPQREGYPDSSSYLDALDQWQQRVSRKALYRWICDKDHDSDRLPLLVQAHLEAMRPSCPEGYRIGVIKAHKLPWEALPTECLTDPAIWKAMLPDMGMTALIRNLAGMTQHGALKPLEPEVLTVIQRLTDENELRKARIHPFNVLMALAVYRSGKAVRGSRAWNPIDRIVDALDGAFYKSFKYVEPTGKRILIALDVSGSMTAPLMGSPVEVCEGAAAMAMTTMRAEKNWHVMAFDQGLRDLKLSASDSLTDVLKKTRNINGGGTDCSLPMLYAAEKGLSVDIFQVYTDNETWAGRAHPVKALQDYRRKSGIAAKLVVCGMTATNFTIADPDDAGMLDVVGFDSSVPALIADFARK